MKPYRGKKSNYILPIIAIVVTIATLAIDNTMQTKHKVDVVTWTASSEPVQIEPIRAEPRKTIQTAEPEPDPYIQLTKTETDLLAATAYFEDNLHGSEGLIGVLLCIRNRLEDGRFGDSIEAICTVGQFHGLSRVGTEEVSQEAFEAVGVVFTDGYKDITEGGLYFCTADTDPDNIKPWLREAARLGGHVFYTDVGGDTD